MPDEHTIAAIQLAEAMNELAAEFRRLRLSIAESDKFGKAFGRFNASTRLESLSGWRDNVPTTGKNALKRVGIVTLSDLYLFEDILLKSKKLKAFGARSLKALREVLRKNGIPIELYYCLRYK